MYHPFHVGDVVMVKHYLMELIGAMFLTIAVSFTGNPIAIGLMLMAIVYVGGHISGGHYNPAVTFAAMLQGRIKQDKAAIYMAMQTAGAFLAVWLFKVITKNSYMPDAAPDLAMGVALLMEVLLTGLFCWVILVVTGKTFKDDVIYGVAIGLTLMAIAFVGGVFNPAIALGAIICNIIGGGGMINTGRALVMLAGPFLGGAAASFGYDFFEKK